MILETVADVHLFEAENALGELILHVVMVDDTAHPTQTSPSLLFLKNYYSGSSYVLPFDHPDAKADPEALRLVHLFLERGNRSWIFDKKNVVQHFPNWKGLLDINLAGFLKKNVIVEASEFETTGHLLARRFTRGMGHVNKVIPLMKHLEAFEELAETAEKMIRNVPIDNAFQKVNGTILETLAEVEKTGIYVDAELFKKHFEREPSKSGFVYSQYNLYTSTGRPSNRFDGVNYAALKHDDGSRRAFVSRHGEKGRMVVIDYSAFHPRIICMLTGHNVSVETDIYAYLASLYFQKESVDDEDIQESKKLTFRQLYGGVETKYQHIKYLSNLKAFIDNQWEFFKQHNYVETPVFKRKITDKHIQDPNPTKLFNYILQAVEGEISISCLAKVVEFLREKKTKAVLYTYDAVLYDYHYDDGEEVLDEIHRLMSMNGLFPMKTYMGKSYQDVALVI